MMTNYNALNDGLNLLLRNSAQFVPMAFHIHSPDSHDWGKRGKADREKNSRDRFTPDGCEKEFLDELASQFSIVCITDHMKVDFACRLAKAAERRDDITVFPGMEVNCKLASVGPDRIHLLVIFPPEKDTTEIDRIFASHPNFPGEARRNGTEDFLIPSSLGDWVKEIEAQGGMLLIAHVDDSHRGHRARFRATRRDTLSMFVTDEAGFTQVDNRAVSEEYKSHIANSGAHAIEIMNPEDRCHYVSFPMADGRLRSIPCVIRSDAHCIEDFADAGKKTFVKVSKPTFACVRDALTFFETRIKFKDDLQETPSPRIVGIRLRSSAGKALFEDATIAFNPNLNCIIGPRGCGKSTVIEAIRYVLGRNALLRDPDKAEAHYTGYRNLALGIQKANLLDTIIEVVYETRANERHCLSATYDPKEDCTTEVFTLAGDPINATAQAILTEYPIRIYSWSEMENLGRQPELQRNLLDRLIDKLPAYQERKASLYAELARMRHAIGDKVGQLEAKLAEDNGTLGRYREFKKDFERVNTPEVAVLFEELDRAREKLLALTRLRQELAKIRKKIDSIEVVNVVEMEVALLSGASAEVNEWWTSSVAGRINYGQVTDSITTLKHQVFNRIDEKDSLLGTFVDQERTLVASKEAELRERTHASTEEELVRGRREQSKRRFDAATKKKAEYHALSSELAGLMELHADLTAQAEELQFTISGARSSSRNTMVDRLNEFKVDGMEIQILFRAGHDRLSACEYMRDRGFLTSPPFGQYKSKKLAEKCCNMATPIQVGRAILEQDADLLITDGVGFDREDTLSKKDGNLLVDHFDPYEFSEDSEVPIFDRRKLDQVLQLQEQSWDDELRIHLNGRPVDQLSPGQRSSAMLPLIALSEATPLIIDQPEDNLDNKMVGSTLTRILADLKERRQIIVATHNPNIIVGGDAEQVIVLAAPEARRAVVDRMGSIDDEQIVESVVGILEGGKAAFQARERRYHQYLEG